MLKRFSCLTSAVVLVSAALVLATPGSAAATAPGLNGVIAAMGGLQVGYEDIVLLNTATGPFADVLRAGASEDAPAWSPSGDKLAVSSGGDLVTVNADGTGANTLVGGCGGSGPSWSPDGTQIAYNGGCSAMLWIIDADGSNPTQVSGGGGFAPFDWSPDGQWIAGVVSTSGNDDIWLIHPNGTGLTQLTSLPGRQIAPSWSPDGSKIAFENDHGADSDVWVVDAAGGVAVALTSGGGNDFHPSWSPDGARIAFGSVRSGGGVFTMAADGSDIVKVPNSEGMGSPAWQPAQATISASKATVISGRAVRLDLRIPSLGTSNPSVLVQRKTRTTPWTDVGTVGVDTLGEASLSQTIEERSWFRAVWTGDATYPGGTSTEALVQATVLVTGHLFRSYKTSGAWHLYHEGNRVWYAAALEPKDAGPKLCFELNVWRKGGWHRGSAACFKVRSDGSSTVYIKDVPRGSRMRIHAAFADRLGLFGDEAPWELFRVTA